MSAPLALQWSRQYCVQPGGATEACAWYHGSWQTLRLLGVFQSIRSDDDFFLPELDCLLGNGVRDILISGAADFALLSRIALMAGARIGDIRVTVIDRCATPLRLNEWLGKRLGLSITTIQGDVLSLQAAGQFDLVCTHSFICFFDQQQRSELIRRWHDLLRPNGKVLTAQRARTNDTEPVIRYREAEILAMAERARRLATDQFDRLGIDPSLAHQLALGYGRHHWTYLVRTPAEIRQLFNEQGFSLERFEPPGDQPAINDPPGTPNQSGSVRWRILASKA
ncbi:MAG: class I SAM-dependent methyltransferase [Xanthomonadales bacterium]|nr:class I SAM-dependent methyltransferase [Xanthomonadales bacterium]